MKKVLNIGILLFAMLFVSASFSSCNRGASCPAYEGLDPGRGNSNNPNSEAQKTGNNKKDVEKKKKEQLNARYNTKKSSSLFPKHMGVKSR
jgi:hypothetical protein